MGLLNIAASLEFVANHRVKTVATAAKQTDNARNPMPNWAIDVAGGMMNANFGPGLHVAAGRAVDTSAYDRYIGLDFLCQRYLPLLR